MGSSAPNRIVPFAAPQRVGDRLDVASRAIDAHFLDLGRALGDALQGLDKLVASLEAMKSAMDQDSVLAINAELEAAARDLLALPARHADRPAMIERLAGAAKRLTANIVEMHENLQYLQVFAINIKITAGGIALAGKEFSDFAQEVGDSAKRGQAHLLAFNADLDALRESFRAAADHERIRASQCAALVPSVPDGLIATAKAMLDHRLQIGQVAGDVANLVRKVQKKVGSALAALQIGDITRQRVEHASEALDLLDGVEGLDPGQMDRVAAFIRGLVSAQLFAAGADFHKDVSLLRVALDGIADDAKEMLRLRDLAFGDAKHDGDGFLRQLEKHVAQALIVVGVMAEADRKALTMASTVSAASIDLSRRITELRAIKDNVQHMALNTTLRCGRIGPAGKPLAVIAAELRHHAGHMETSAVQAMASLGDLTDDAHRMSQANTGETAGFSDAVGVGLSDVARRLREAGDKVEMDLTCVAREGDALVAGLSRASASMHFQRQIGSIVEEATDALAEDGGDGSPVTADISAPLGDLLARIAKRYTMAQEREVHRRMTDRLGAEAPAEGLAIVPDDMELDDVLF